MPERTVLVFVSLEVRNLNFNLFSQLFQDHDSSIFVLQPAFVELELVFKVE